MRIAIAKEKFNRKIPLLTGKLNIEFRKKLVRYYIWSTDLCDSETWLDTKKIGTKVFEELQNVRLAENEEDKIVRESN